MRDLSIGAITLAAALLLAGCATQRPPTVKLTSADVAIQHAMEDDAAQHAPLELRVAREKLDRARKLADDGKETEASRLADEAQVDAQVADAKARAEKARQQTDEARKTMETLRRETERSVLDR